MPGRDSYWDQTSLLINGNAGAGSGGWDAGPNNLAVTTTGNPQRDAASPFQSAPGYWSNSFDGSGDYLSTPLDSVNIRTAFTIEAWVRVTSPYFYLFSASTTSSIGNQLYFGEYNDGNVYLGDASTNNISFSRSLIPQDKWCHIAITFDGTTYRVFVDGVVVGSSTTLLQNYTLLSIQIGARTVGDTRYLTGYMSNFRIVKGTALYTAAFTPPTTALTAVSGTSLLTCQDNRFKDNSTNNFTLTAVGNVSVEPESPFRGGSVYFPGGTTGYQLVTVPSTTFGTSDFTIEFWFKSASNFSTSFDWITARFGTTVKFQFYYFQDGRTGYYDYMGTDFPSSYGLSWSVDKWYHMAICRSGNNLYAFRDGVVLASTPSYTVSLTAIDNFIIGTNTTRASQAGYISNLRVVKGTALYTSAFTPPGNELTPVANTFVLTSQSPTQLVDYSTNNFAVTTTGSAAVSNAGPGLLSRKNSVYFDGSGDYLKIPSLASVLTTGEHTLEAWVYLNNYPASGSGYIISGSYKWRIGDNIGWLFSISATGILNVSASNGSWNQFPSVMTSTTPVPLNTWAHVAWTRDSSNVMRFFINGVDAGGSTTRSQSLNLSNANTYGSIVSDGLHIGVAGPGDSVYTSFFRGYISNVNIQTGVNSCKYTSNFTPSNQPLEPSSTTVFLSCQSEIIDDSSTNNAAITVAGTPFTSQFNPYDITRNTYGSYYNPNTSPASSVTTTTSSAVNIGTGDFTAECWFNGTSDNSVYYLWSINGTTNSLTVWWNGAALGVRVNTTNVISGASITNNAWNHVAVVRQSGTMTMYINGVSVGTYSSTENFDTSSITLSSTGNKFYGFISNARLSVGVTRYTAAFTPSLTHFQPDSQTTALLAGTSDITPRNKACFVDGSSNKFVVTGYGNASQSTFSPYTTRNGQDYSAAVNGGSTYFDGATDYLSLPVGAPLNFGTGDFTVECWVNPNALASYSMIFGYGTPNQYWSVRSTGVLHFYDGTNIFEATTSGVSIGKWAHVAISRQGSTLRQFVNGVQVLSSTCSTSIGASTGTNLWVGGSAAYPSQHFFNGYISDFRIVKGTAVYQANFPVPTQPLGLYSVGGGTTSLYLPFSAGSIIDQTGKNSIEPVGDVKNTTLIKKYNNSSIVFDGNGDNLLIYTGNQLKLTEDFTVEMWVYPTRIGSFGSQFMGLYTNTSMSFNGQFTMVLNNSTGVYGPPFVVNVYIANGSTWGASLSGTTTVPLDTWTHIALTRSGNTWTIWVNGISDATTTYSGPLGTTSTMTRIGTMYETGGATFNGFMDDIRVTKGVARYTANFTVPTTNLPTAPIYTQPVVTNYQDQGTDLGSKYVTKSYLMDVYTNLIPAFNNGQVYSWGSNSFGGLGIGTTQSKLTPTLTLGGSSYKQISSSCYGQFVAAIKSDGTAWAWGYNAGNLGNGNQLSASSPVSVLGGVTNWRTISAGQVHTVAIKDDGTAWSWGNNSLGQLGTGTTSNYSSPVSVVGGGTNWKQVSCGASHTTFIKADGTLWTCGYNAYGQLGTGNISNYSSPVSVVGGGTNWKQVAGGYRHTAAIKTDGTLWTWGWNNIGQLGTGNMSNYSSPVSVVGGGTDWKQVACGYRHTAAVKTDGSLWAWGYNIFGQLGNNSNTSQLSPVSVVGGVNTWKQVSTGFYSTSAVKTDGTLWVWGSSNDGQIGINTTSHYSSPVMTTMGGTNWKQSVSGYNATYGIFDSNL